MTDFSGGPRAAEYRERIERARHEARRGYRNHLTAVIEDKLRQTSGYIEQLEYDAAHPETATEFNDWKNPDTNDSSSA